MTTPSLAVQLFTLRDHTGTAAELANTLGKIAQMGYKAVQLSAVGAMNGDSPEVDAPLARRMLDDYGLKCIATHRPWNRLCEAVEEEIEFHLILGCDYVAIGGVPRDEYANSYEGYRRFVADCQPVIDSLARSGIRFGHHNHSHEFYRPERSGKTLEDILIEEASKQLFLELDLYWIEHAGLNCVRILEKVPGRVPVIHIKDKEVIEGKNETRMAPIGEGNLDWDGILPACQKAGVEWYAVEQDQCYRDPFDCLQSSYDYLSSKGLC